MPQSPSSSICWTVSNPEFLPRIDGPRGREVQLPVFLAQDQILLRKALSRANEPHPVRLFLVGHVDLDHVLVVNDGEDKVIVLVQVQADFSAF